jgi:predicted SAM-dependent methyltransferase
MAEPRLVAPRGSRPVLINLKGLRMANGRHAPVLELADLFDRPMCQRLLRTFAERNGKYAPVVDLTVKNRRDFVLRGALRDEVWRLLCARLWPAVQQAFNFPVTRFEYLLIGCYAGEHSGHFLPHRDNDSPITAHRRFALSLNLNDDYDGGELHFPEYQAWYRPPAGAGVVFSCSLLHGARPVTDGHRFVLVAMVGGEADLAIYEAARRGSRGLPAKAREARLLEDARQLREIAGGVTAFGDDLARVAGAAERLDWIHTELTRLQTDLQTARAPFLNDQAAVRRASGKPELKLHLGCGGQRLPGWINIDARGGDLRMDLRWPLPFADRSVRYVFACHVVEHLYRRSEAPRLFADLRRVMMPSGVLRLVVPDLEQCLRAYVAGDDQFFADRGRTWSWSAACQSRLDHFLAYAGADQALEDLDGHKYGYDFETLSQLLHQAGFSVVSRSGFMASRYPELRVDDRSQIAAARTGVTYYSLFVEATV